MKNRRHFLKGSIIGGTALATAPLSFIKDLTSAEGVPYELRLEVADKFFTGTQCWVHPRVGIIPGAGKGNAPKAVLTMNTLELEGSDVFKGLLGMYTNNLGKSWSKPKLMKALAPRENVVDDVTRPIAISDFWPKYHKASGELLGIGHTVVYTPEWKVAHPRPRHTAYATYDPKREVWSDWKLLEMPEGDRFYNSGAGCVQRYDLEDGNILLPIYYSPPEKNARVIVLRCSFDGQELKYLEEGNEISIRDDGTRGLHEPSIARFNGEYFLTIRNDRQGFITKSKDGLQYGSLRTWRFDDGSELGNYNTQQHWVTYSDGLFLVYTRRGADNDHVFRHRAPLFMAQIDPDRLCVIRETERILVPERGARLGNFGVVDISPDETWVTVSEWMQPKGVEQYGSDGSIWIAKIDWKKKNSLFKG